MIQGILIGIIIGLVVAIILVKLMEFNNQKKIDKEFLELAEKIVLKEEVKKKN